MNPFRQDPGPCPICGAAHSACTAGGGRPITVRQLPERDARAAREAPPAPVSTKDYRGSKGKR